jgi:hypothetical protein
MTPSPAARVAAVLTLGALLAVGRPAPALGAPGSPPAPQPVTSTPTPLPTVPATLPLRLRLSSVDPVAPQPGDRLLVTGTVTNPSTATFTDLAVRLVVGPTITTRDGLSVFAAGGDQPFGFPLVQTTTTVRTRHGRLAPGGRATFRLRAAVTDLGLGGIGVYEFGVEAVAAGPAGTGVAGRVRTFLPWAPLRPTDSVCTPLRVGWLWPLVDQPARLSGSTFADVAALAGELRPGGRLDRLLLSGLGADRRPPTTSPPPRRRRTGKRPAPRAGPRLVPVTWVVDPLLVDDAQVLSRTHPGRLVSAAAARSARQWLATLRRAGPGLDAIVLPYGDPDVVALERAGLFADVRTAVRVGDALAGNDARLSSDGLYWPPGGLVDRRTAAALAPLFQGLVLAGTAMPPLPTLFYTPTGRANLGLPTGILPVALSDPTLDGIVSTGASQGNALGEQRFLAETLLIDLELPCHSRTLVIEPDRRWNPPAGYPAGLLQDTAQAPWLQPVQVGGPAGAITAPAATSGQRQGLNYPSAARGAELSAGYLARVRRLRRQIDELESIVPPGAGLDLPLTLGLLWTESSAWRQDPVGGNALRQAVLHAEQSQAAQVRVVSRGLYTLSSRSGTIPVTVANGLAAPVEVVLTLQAGPDAKVLGGDSFVVHLPAHVSEQVHVRTQARIAGVFGLSVQLYTRQHPPAPFGPPVRLLVRSTAYGAVALGITGGALAVLLVALVFRLLRRARRARRAAAG